MYAYAHAFSEGEVQTWLNRQLSRYQKYHYGLWAVIRKEDERFIGQCGLSNQRVGGETVLSLDYLFQRDYWHQGYATEAAAGAKEYAFATINAPRLYAIVRDTNIASMNVAIRNGMLVHGRQTKHYYGLIMPHLVFAVENPAYAQTYVR